MKRFKVNKLVRDKFSPKSLQAGITGKDIKILDDNLYLKELQNKLLEETKEVIEAKDKNELISEFADVYEVLEAMIKFYNISFDEIKKKKDDLITERGNFDGKTFCEYIEVPDNSELFHKFSSRPEKYPEIKIDQNK